MPENTKSLGLTSGPSQIGRSSRFLMLVKTYPIPSRRYEETVCCAGIDAETRAWIRMYPVNFRSLDEYARFAKWQFIDATWSPSASDARPESRRVHQDSIRAGEKLPAGSGWRARRAWLDPIVDPSLEYLLDANLSRKQSLGAIRPAKIEKFIIRPASAASPEQVEHVEQLRLEWTGSTEPTSDLELLPFEFLYRFTCRDDRCKGHEMQIFDWELGQAYRNFRRIYRTRHGPGGWEAKLRQKYELELPSRDLHLLLGTHHRWGSWLIVGVVAPPYPQVGGRNRADRSQALGKDGAVTLGLV
jgi:hypothetical protein